MSSRKRDLGDVAARFVRKARSDEIALDKLADDPDVPDDLIGFHAQQALKAALANAGIAPPRIQISVSCLRSPSRSVAQSHPVQAEEDDPEPARIQDRPLAGHGRIRIVDPWQE